MTKRTKKQLKKEILDTLGHRAADDAYYNLEGVIEDLKHEKNHCPVCVNTIERVAKQISNVIKLVQES